MIQKQVHKFVVKSHHWRDIGHSEMAELYVSISMRTLAVSMVGVFLPIYLYRLNYSLEAIIGYFLIFSLVRLPMNFVSAKIVGRIGPKHTMAISMVAEVTFMLMLVSLETYAWPLLAISVVHSMSNGLFFTSYHVAFSKIKQTADAGKEIGHMILLQKIFGMAGPFLGGIIATFLDIRYSIAIAIILMIGSLVPLFLSNEPVRLHQHVTYKGLAPKIWVRRRNMLAMIGYNLSSFVNTITWVLFIGLAVFTNNTYAYIGLLATITTFISAFLARYIGRRTDLGDGPKILRISALFGFMLGIGKIFINSPLSASLNGLADAQDFTAKQIPMSKGFYAESDEFPGQRIAYMAVVETIVHLSRIPVWIAIIIALRYFSGDQFEVLRWSAVIVSIAGLLVLLEKFPSLRNSKVK